MIRIIFLFLVAVCWNGPLTAQIETTPTSPEEKRKVCRKYESKMISFSGEIFKVENCRRRPVDSKEVYAWQKKGKPIIDVDATPIRLLESKKPRPYGTSKVRTCKQLEGKFVTFSFTDVYLVKKCLLQRFPDWASYLSFQDRAGRKNEKILALTIEEFTKLKVGRELPTVLVEEQYSQDEPLEILAVSDACEGINGRFVSYYSRLYKIDRCRKRPVDAAAFTRTKSKPRKIIEITSQQWLSLPSGDPWKG